MTKPNLRPAFATVVMALLAFLGWWWATDDAASLSDIGANEGFRATPLAKPAATSTGYAFVPRPASVVMRQDAGVGLPTGSRVDGWLTVVDGRFIPDRHATRLFDYFLSTYGEMDPERIRELVEREARKQVPADQVAAVMDFFDRYTAFVDRAGELVQGQAEDAHFRAVKELQREVFGADAERLFERENVLTEHSLARQHIMSDSTLTAAERYNELAKLEAALPAEHLSAPEAMTHQEEVAQVVDQMRDDGLSEGEIFDYRADEFGDLAAARARELEAQRAEWERRLNAYRPARDAVYVQRLPMIDEAQALEAVRAQHFNAREIVQVREIDAHERRLGGLR